MGTTFNVLDIFFFVFTFIFVLTAFFRGFVKEIFSLLNWIIAFAASYLLSPFATDLLADYFTSRVVLDGAVRTIIFIIFFIITALSSANLRDSLQEKVPTAFDKSLGIFFGFIKTLLIFGFIYSLYFNLYNMALGSRAKENPEPKWLKDAKCYSLLKFSGDAVNPIVKTFMNSISVNLEKALPKEENLDEKIDEIMEENSLDTETKQAKEINDKVEKVKNDVKKEVKEEKKDEKKSDVKDAKPTAKDAGYSKKDIEKMNRLIDIVDK